jgi:hypothetical protein
MPSSRGTNGHNCLRRTGPTKGCRASGGGDDDDDGTLLPIQWPYGDIHLEELDKNKKLSMLGFTVQIQTGRLLSASQMHCCLIYPFRK